MYTNANSLKNKLSELRLRIDEGKPDVIGITEVWTKDEIVLQGYHPAYRYDREEDQKGGGVMLFVKSDLEVLDCPELSSPNIESVWCYVKLSSKEKLLVGVCYRPPASSVEYNEGLNLLLKQTPSTRTKHILVMGDFNYPQIDWDTGSVDGSEGSSQERFFDAVNDLFWLQCVNFPTRFKEGNEPSLLDLVFANEENAIESIVGSDPLGKSDHCVITWKYVYISKRPNRNNQDKPTRRNFKKGNYAQMSDDLSQLDWSILENMGVEQTWSKIKAIVNISIEQHVPLSHQKNTVPRSPWWTKRLEVAVKLKYSLWKEYRKTKTTEDYKRYTVQRNKTTSLIRLARCRHETKIAEHAKQDPSSISRYIRSQQKLKPKVGPLTTENGTLTQSDMEAAKVLNKFFQSVFVEEDDSEVPEFPARVQNKNILEHIELTLQEVHRELEALDINKSAGPDGIPNSVMKMCADQMAGPLKCLFQKTLDLGKLPVDWKEARVTPLFKKGSKKAPGNYRPISLTSQPCKVLERIVRKRIVEHLDDHDLISKHQHGFTKRRSCQTNLIEAMEEWTKTLDEGHALDIAYLDFQKAFDTVPHRRLKKKLYGYGIRGRLLDWICDFLHNRRQHVTIGNSTSNSVDIKSGVPQGSVLGPTLFLIYVNELPTVIKSSIKMFADDAKVYRPIRLDDDVAALQADLQALCAWSLKWLLRFNVAKCKIMHCGLSNQHNRYYMTENGLNRELKATTMERDLGVVTTSSFKATEHCYQAANKASSALRLLRIAFASLNMNNFKPLYTSYVRPHLDYCLSAVGPHLIQDLKALEKVQRRASKLVREIKHLPYHQRLERLELPTIEERLSRGDLIETYKILTGKLAVDPNQFFERNFDDRTRGHHLKLAKRRCSSQARAKFFTNRVVTAWNSLPEKVVAATSTNHFKNLLDRHRAAAP